MRDKLRAIERTMESQKMAAFAKTEIDVLGYRPIRRWRGGAALRHPRGHDRRARRVPARERRRSVRRGGAVGVHQAVLRRGQLDPAARPACRCCRPTRTSWSRSSRRAAASKVDLAVPQRGEGRALMDLAARNAAETLGREQARWLADEGKTLAALEELAGALGLAAPPLRIECYDISTIQGTNTVGSMVVFEEGRPRSGEYRRFRVRTVRGSTGRLRQPPRGAAPALLSGARGRGGSAEELRWRLPDLVVIDGGLGQVNAAREVLDAAGPARHARHRPGQGARGDLPARPRRRRSCCRPTRRRSTWSSACATRRTASRSPITASCAPSSRRSRCSTRCPASGRRASGRLLRVFGSTKQMRGATVDEIASVPGISRALAEKIHRRAIERLNLQSVQLPDIPARMRRFTSTPAAWSSSDGCMRALFHPDFFIIGVGLAALAIDFCTCRPPPITQALYRHAPRP